MSALQQVIEQAFENRQELSPTSAPSDVRSAVAEVLAGLDSGSLRVAEKIDGTWVVHEWVKKAVLLSFRLNDNVLMAGGETNFYDKVPSKYADYSAADFRSEVRLRHRATFVLRSLKCLLV